jgi:hypothetical protein
MIIITIRYDFLHIRALLSRKLYYLGLTYNCDVESLQISADILRIICAVKLLSELRKFLVTIIRYKFVSIFLKGSRLKYKGLICDGANTLRSELSLILL